MGKRSKTQGLSALGIGALFIFNAAVAAPPPGRQDPLHAQSQAQPLRQHLDLRAPSPAVEPAEKTPSFPFMSQRHSLGSQAQIQLPTLGADGMRSRPSVQEFVQRVHHEGLPVARLFESKTALVHLGLSPKGKPGLWLVQKTH
jgi:hypothetical protein